MASVFGYATVTKVVKLEEKRIAHIIYDEDLQDKQVVIFAVELPVHTKLYWEFDCKEKKTHYTVI